jgi:tRNA(fMet)-specific endonuclease VapC
VLVVSLWYLLDTNIVSEPLRPQPDPGVMVQLAKHAGRAAIATIVWHELLFGCYRLPASRKRSAIERYLQQVVRQTLPLLPYDAAAAEWHAAERARLTNIGQTPSFVDSQIAAIAKVNGLTLITANVEHYSTFQGLRVDDWRT